MGFTTLGSVRPQGLILHQIKLHYYWFKIRRTNEAMKSIEAKWLDYVTGHNESMVFDETMRLDEALQINWCQRVQNGQNVRCRHETRGQIGFR